MNTVKRHSGVFIFNLKDMKNMYMLLSVLVLKVF